MIRTLFTGQIEPARRVLLLLNKMQSSVSFLYVKCIFNENRKKVFVKGEYDMMNEMMNNNGFNDYELCEDELI